ncbi:MAG: aminotransferase class IV family protein [Methylocystis sp.]|nr:aminotransferase class IV family protein [Methylocystis sp.]
MRTAFASTSAQADDFGLIETLLWTRRDGFHLYAEHVERLRASSRALGFPFDKTAFTQALGEAVREPMAERLRVRFVLNKDARIETSVTAIEPIPEGALWRVALARRRFSSSDPLLRHKTTRRELYDGELSEASVRCGADEVLFLNERDEVCEGARANVFLARDGALLTPPLASGLLPGTLRASLLASGRAQERVLRLADFSADAEFYMGNSVRGLVRGALVEEK